MKLFIVGNGFDLLHGLPTAYSDFRQYLITKYPGADEYDELIPESIMMPDGKVRYEIDQVAGYISRIIDECDGENWRNLESFLGTTIFDNLLYDLDCVDMEMPDKETMRVVHRNEELSENMKQVFIKVKSLFCDWVREMLGNIDMVGIRRNDIAAVLAEGNAFLSFNYTKTLEKAYGISAVCHIHGVVGNADEDIFFGHGDLEDIPESIRSFGADWNLNQLKRELRKNTEAALREHWDFFAGLLDVESIHSFGFSFSPVDMVYLEEIARRSKGVSWYLDSHAACDPNKQEILQSLGFRVEIDDRW